MMVSFALALIFGQPTLAPYKVQFRFLEPPSLSLPKQDCNPCVEWTCDYFDDESLSHLDCGLAPSHRVFQNKG